MTIGAFIKAKRKELGISQPVLADYAGVGLRFLRELEEDKPSVQLDKTREVLKMFNAELQVVETKDRSRYAQD